MRMKSLSEINNWQHTEKRDAEIEYKKVRGGIEWIDFESILEVLPNLAKNYSLI